MTHLELFHGLVAAGMKMRYGNKPGKAAMLRVLWEKKHIIDADYVDYYLMAFGVFHHYAKSAGIGFWARGAMNSSIVCFCFRQELFANLKDITPNEAETAWQRLTSNPRAFLKAHAVSRVMAKYMFEF